MKNWVRCKLCPRECTLGPGERGNCRSRINYRGKLITLVYGKTVAANPYDPIEKKPLFHFLPGTRCFSIATAGCNLHCKFCQNYEISQLNPDEATEVYDLPPAQVVAAAVTYRTPSIAYTYSEPLTFFEYTRDTQILARKHGIKNILVTAGYINEAPLRELCASSDAANVDLKGFSEDFYREVCEGTLAPVLRTLEVMVELGVWIEITNLVIPGLNDDLEMIKRMCGWILERLGSEVPLHFSRFRPMFKLAHLPPTPVDFLFQAQETARGEGLHFVYVGNVEKPGGGDTICPNCRAVVVSRYGFSILKYNIQEGKCGACGTKIAGVWS